MRKMMWLAALAAGLTCGVASAQQISVKIGVLSDMSSLYSDIGGAGSVIAAKLAIADFAKSNPDVKVELISGDHQNKPDVGSQIANQWFDVEKVDMIVDVPNSGVALAVSQIVTRRTKCFWLQVRPPRTSPVPNATPTPSIGPMTRGCWPTAPARRW